MAWPTPQDYNEAVQNPAFNFADAELKAGSPELTSLGLPRPITGGFASVYRLRCGTRDWAVRCFLRDVPDQQRRYAAISRHLASARLPYMVGFEFLPQGIKVRGQWYPILKMEWVQGEPLNVYIESRLRDPIALNALARRWMNMLQALEQACIAHGDLQHGNVLVTNGDLKLIDYDGMFVPALAGQTSNELGHRNYQHPRRGASDFGLFLDHFSAWVVYVSLVALSAEPDLWTQFKAGDESLLFRQEDFDRPQASAALALLAQHPQARVRALAIHFQSLLARSLPDIPPLESLAPRPSAPSKGTRSAPDWLGRLRPNAAPAPVAVGTGLPVGQSAAAPAVKPAWVVDVLTRSESRKAFCLSLRPPRLLAALSMPISVAGALFLHGSLALTFARGLAFGLVLIWPALWLRYRQEPAAHERRVLLARKRVAQSAIAVIERTEQRNERQKAALRSEEDHRRAALTGWRADLEAKEKQELRRIHAALKNARDVIVARRKQEEQQEAGAFARTQARLRPQIEALEMQVAEIARAQEETLTRALEAQQRDFIAAFLRRQSVWRATIPGIGRAFKLRLLSHGLVTAADVSGAQELRWLGKRCGEALQSWRQSLEAQAHAAMPHALSAEQTQRLSAKFTRRMRRLEARLTGLTARLSAEEDAIRAAFQQRGQALDAQEAAARAQAAARTQQVHTRYVASYARIDESLTWLATDTVAQCQEIDADTTDAQKLLPHHHWQITEIDRELEPYRNLTFGRYLRAVCGVKAPGA